MEKGNKNLGVLHFEVKGGQLVPLKSLSNTVEAKMNEYTLLFGEQTVCLNFGASRVAGVQQKEKESGGSCFPNRAFV